MRSPFNDAISAIILTTLFLAPPAAAAEPRPSPEARAHFKLGVAALKRGHWEQAYREFKEAYSITPRWTILGNLGIAAQHLERDGEAIDSMEQYLKRGKEDISAAEQVEVREAIDALRVGTADVTLDASAPFSVVDTRAAEIDVVNEYGPFVGRATFSVRAGQHTFSVVGAGLEVPAWSVSLVAGDDATHEFRAETGPSPPPVEKLPPSLVAREQQTVEAAAPSRTAPYVLWSIGAAGAGGAVVVGFRAQSLQQDADDDFAQRCPFGATGFNGCNRVTEGSERAARWRTAALVTGIGALGALVAGTVVYFTGESSTSAPASDSALQPWVTPTSMGLAGAF